MMICWDIQFSIISRRLAANGADIVAVPIYGGNPKLLAARAIENQFYAVSSTYGSPDYWENWMSTSVWGPTAGDWTLPAGTARSPSPPCDRVRRNTGTGWATCAAGCSVKGRRCLNKAPRPGSTNRPSQGGCMEVLRQGLTRPMRHSGFISGPSRIKLAESHRGAVSSHVAPYANT